MSAGVQNCGTCAYFYRRGCRARPPALVVVGTSVSTGFPSVTADDWCGEWSSAAGAMSGPALAAPTSPQAAEATP